MLLDTGDHTLVGRTDRPGVHGTKFKGLRVLFRKAAFFLRNLVCQVPVTLSLWPVGKPG